MKARHLIANYRAPQGRVARVRVVGLPMILCFGAEAMVREFSPGESDA